MCPGNETIQCALGMGLANVLYKWDYPMSSGNEASQCALGNETSQGALGMGLSNVPWEWD